jgi:hypothetical protein
METSSEFFGSGTQTPAPQPADPPVVQPVEEQPDAPTDERQLVADGDVWGETLDGQIATLDDEKAGRVSGTLYHPSPDSYSTVVYEALVGSQVVYPGCAESARDNLKDCKNRGSLVYGVLYAVRVPPGSDLDKVTLYTSQGFQTAFKHYDVALAKEPVASAFDTQPSSCVMINRTNAGIDVNGRSAKWSCPIDVANGNVYVLLRANKNGGQDCGTKKDCRAELWLQ